MSNNRYEKIEFSKFNEMVLDHNSQLIDTTSTGSAALFQPNRSVAIPTDTGLGMSLLNGQMNKVAFRQVCSRVNAPHQWFQTGKCPDDLERDILTRMSSTRNENLLWRFKGNELRAVLSDKYLVYNHSDFWSDVNEAIKDTDLATLNPVIWKPSVGSILDAWILFDNVNADPEGGISRMYDGGDAGGLRPAIRIRNTEDGTGKVKIDSGMFRSYCTNGVIFGWNAQSAMAAEHLGKSIDHMQLKVVMAIGEAAEMCQLGITKFVEATKVRIKADVINKVVADWSKVYSISTAVSADWLNMLNGSQTWGDIVMATSDFAGRQDDREVMAVLEEASGAILAAGAPRGWTIRS